ncbi:MAG: sugar phosphate isomerase/epimerase family protein, partial [Planctomycetia bacterium]
ARYDLKVATIGSPIGKVKLVDVDDGTRNVYVPFEKYLAEDVAHAVKLAHRFDTKLIRGFSFYPPKGDDPKKHWSQAVDQIGRIAEACRKEGVVFGVEMEPNLMGDDGVSLAAIADAVRSPALALIYDGANLCAQNLPAARCYEEYAAMKKGIGWMHVKDYKIDPSLEWHGHVDEERLKNFVPVDAGDSGYELVLRDFKKILPEVEAKMTALGAPGVFLDLEPHVKGGGQFGGFSGPDGMGVALRALCRLLDYVGIDYSLRSFDGLKR